MNILIVHHSGPFANDLAERIRSWGHRVEACCHTPDAVGLMRHGAFDLVLLDVGPSGAFGEQAIDSVKVRQPDIKIVAMSDSVSRKIQTRIREKGIIYYMLVPSEIPHLKPLLEHLSARTMPGEAAFFPYRELFPGLNPMGPEKCNQLE